jgi:ATP-dependent RNA helicase DDX21
MLNRGFADDVEQIMEASGQDEKAQCLLFSATTPDWVKEIAEQYQKDDVLSIDSTTKEGGGSRVATTVRHLAIQVPPGVESRKQILEDIIAVEISKESENRFNIGDDEESEKSNPVAHAINLAKRNTTSAMQQKIFGKTIVFTETKSLADDLVSGGVFKSLTAQALHGDIGQKQRDSTLAAFRAGAFNVLVATDVAARGIDIQDVDLVVQFEPPKDVDTYVHRSGRTGRAGRSGTSVLLFGTDQARNIVSIERNLGHNFKFTLAGPPSIEAALNAAAKTSAIAVCGIPEQTAQHFTKAASELLEQEDGNAELIIARCLAAISRRGSAVESRSMLTGEKGLITIEMAFEQGNRNVSPADVMFTVSKIARMIRRENDEQFLADVGKIITNSESGTAMFDMTFDEANKLIEYCDENDNVGGGATFSVLKEMDIQRDRYFGMGPQRGKGRNNYRGGGGGYRGNNNYRGDGGYRGRRNDNRGRYDDNRRGGYDNRRNNNRRYDDNFGSRDNNFDGRRRNPRRFSTDRGWH